MIKWRGQTFGGSIGKVLILVFMLLPFSAQASFYCHIWNDDTSGGTPVFNVRSQPEAAGQLKGREVARGKSADQRFSFFAIYYDQIILKITDALEGTTSKVGEEEPRLEIEFGRSTTNSSLNFTVQCTKSEIKSELLSR